MKIEDVKQWQCGNGLAVAVNPCKQWERHPFNEKISYGAYDWKVFNQWASDPANQPVTDLSGIYNSEQVKEVWELKDIDSDFWILEAKLSTENSTYEYFENFYKMLSNDIETRRRLVLAEADKTESAVYGPGDDNYGRDNKIAALCNTDSASQSQYFDAYDEKFKELHSGIHKLVSLFSWKDFFFACIKYQKEKVNSKYKITAP